MDIKVKTAAAELIPVAGDESDSGPGHFHAILSTSKTDRDGDNLHSDEWELPLPERIQINGDHDNKHIMSTIGSGPPELKSDGKIHVMGDFATTGYAQDARKLINGKHITHMSVAYREKKTEKGVSRELINGSFVVVPSNTDCVVLESKSHDLDPDKIDVGTIDKKDLAAVPAAPDLNAKSLVAEIISEYRKQYDEKMPGSVLPEGFTASLGIDEKTLEIKDWTGKVVLSHKFSQAPEAPPQGADPTADQAKQAVGFAKAKALALLSQTS